MNPILIVDDKEENRYMLQALLAGHGYATETARHGAEALTKARIHSPSLVVSDLLMPVMDGYTLLRHWKADARLRHIPFIVYTATYTEPEDERLALNLGADAFILKPCDPDIFLERIRAVLHSPPDTLNPPVRPQPSDEKEILKTYSETLIRKLEEKTLLLAEANRSLELALERLQLAMKASRAGTWDYDLITGQVDWDDQMLALYGKTAEELESGIERWYHAIHPDDREAVSTVYESTIKGKQDSFDMEFRIFRGNDGALRYIRAMSVVICDPAGRPVRMIGINSDVTEERAREKKLTEALAHEKELAEKARAGDRAKSEFLAVMSHEIRTPLNGILGFSELLVQTPDLPDECKDYARTILNSGEALLHILDDVLDFSRIESGRLQFKNEPFAPRDVLEITRILLAQQAVEKNLQVVVSVEEGVPASVMGDIGRVRQILFNIAGNAVKFTDQGRITLSLRVNKQNGRLEFMVKDTGPGIPQEHLENIFLPFTQSDSSQTRRHGGVGLGLSISRRLAELMGGDITVRSELGRGAEFIISLPLIEVDATQSTTSIGVPRVPLNPDFAREHPLRVLVVEDDKINLRLILTLIRRLGYEPIAAVNGIEAIQAFENFSPDCVFMDIHMPEMDGIEATKRIRELESNTQHRPPAFITALTANIFPADRRRCFDAGMNAYLNKPVKLDNIALSLLKAEEHAKNGRQASEIRPGNR